jgi:hypothetical protein
VANEHDVVMSAECPRCKSKQKIHVSTDIGGIQVGDQEISCIKCDNYFEVSVADRIIRGRRLKDQPSVSLSPCSVLPL